MSNRYVLPVPPACVITQTWEEHKQRAIQNGWAWKPGMSGKSWYYPGTDFAPDSAGDVPIFACQDGVVVYAGPDKTQGIIGGYGRYMQIDHGGGDHIYYCHLNAALVNAGATVKAGQRIGIMGWTGNVWPKGSGGRHLHCELRRNGMPTDIMPMIVGTAVIITPQTTTDFVIPTIPTPPVFKLHAPLNMRSQPLRDPDNNNWVRTLPGGEEVSVIAIIRDGDNVWAKIGHQQYIALQYGGVVMGEFLNVV